MRRVVLVSDPYHSDTNQGDCARSRPRCSDVTDAHEPDQGHVGVQAMLGETLRVAAGRLFGYARLDRHRSVVKLVPGLATL